MTEPAITLELRDGRRVVRTRLSVLSGSYLSMREPAALSRLQIPPGERRRSAGAWAEQSHSRRDLRTDRDLMEGPRLGLGTRGPSGWAGLVCVRPIARQARSSPFGGSSVVIDAVYAEKLAGREAAGTQISAASLSIFQRVAGYNEAENATRV